MKKTTSRQVGTSYTDYPGILFSAIFLLLATYGYATEFKLTASDAATSDEFGRSVSISGDYVIVGAYLDDVTYSDQGSAYIFVRSGTNWTEQAKLTASDAAASDEFGISVSISGDYVIVGAYGDEVTYSNQGSAYVFEKPGGGWTNMTETAKLTASDAAASDKFGNSVSISGDYVVVGADFDYDGGSASGSAYAFLRSGGSWSQKDKQTASDAAADDRFGVVRFHIRRLCHCGRLYG